MNRFVIDKFGRWMVRVGLVLTVGASFLGTGGGVTRVHAARNADCVLSSESFTPPPVGTEPYWIEDFAVFGENDAWVTGEYGADYVTRTEFLLEWSGTEWVDRMPEWAGKDPAGTVGQEVRSSERNAEPFSSSAHTLLGGTSTTDVWRISRFGEAMHWDGSGWSMDSTLHSGPFSDMEVVSGKLVWLIGWSGTNSKQPLFAQWRGKNWKTVSGPAYPEAVELFDIKGIRRNDAWAVGRRGQGDGMHALTMRWDGKKWNDVPNPAKAGTRLYGVAALSRNDVWAVGVREVNNVKHALTMHWDGAAWKVIKLPKALNAIAGTELNSIAVVEGNTVEAVGSIATGALVVRWDGNRWSQRAVPPSQGGLEKVVHAGDGVWASNYFEVFERGESDWAARTLPWFGYYEGPLRAVYAAGAEDVWAVGEQIEHFDGEAWRVVDVPDALQPPSAYFALDGIGTSAVWAAGYLSAGTETELVILHWDGGQWSRMDAPAGVNDGVLVTDLAVIGESDIWASGRMFEGVTRKALTWHWDGAAWTEVTVPPLPSQSETEIWRLYAQSTDDVWGIGPGIWHWDGSAWSFLSSEFPGDYPEALMVLREDDVWASVNDAFLHYDGSTWTKFPAGGQYSNRYYGFAAFGSDDIYAMGSVRQPFGQFYGAIQHWDGTTWTAIENVQFSEISDDVSGLMGDTFWTVASVYPYRNSPYGVIRRYTRVCE